tara:strand:- start:1421 stop:1708 length:288 start_codon:yes stop_codon:yes gene_type:complete
MFGRYLDYLRDNPEGYWFKRKLFGWGWTPVMVEGWIVTLAFILFIVYTGLELASISSPTNKDLAWFFFKLIASIAILIFICYRAGERPKWSWGNF